TARAGYRAQPVEHGAAGEPLRIRNRHRIPVCRVLDVASAPRRTPGRGAGRLPQRDRRGGGGPGRRRFRHAGSVPLTPTHPRVVSRPGNGRGGTRTPERGTGTGWETTDSVPCRGWGILARYPGTGVPWREPDTDQCGAGRLASVSCAGSVAPSQ